MTHKWVWPRSCDPISKIYDPPLITGKTSKVNYRYINNNKTANIKDTNLKFTTTCKVDCAYVIQLKLQK